MGRVLLDNALGFGIAATREREREREHVRCG